jgi:large conductance mechanosensitive channel
MRGFVGEFRDFIMRGNMLDMAVAFIMGATFNSLIKALVDDLMMPLIGILTSSVSFTDIIWHVGPAELKVGAFLGTVITFLLTSLAVFLMVKGVNAMYRKTAKNQTADEPDTQIDTELSLLQEIRDALSERK